MMTIPALFVALIILAMVMYRLVDAVSRASDAHGALDVEEALLQLDTLARRRALLIHEIKEVELDHEMGKVGVDDYGRLRRRLEREWLKVDAELGEIGAQNEAFRNQVDAELSRRLEALVEDEGERRLPARTLCPSCGAASDGGLCEGCEEIQGLTHGASALAMQE